ncbi:hypothetical protein BJX63DRAFT_376423 [Aspergillus granulosus]|uniref:Secreted protein n=1 Tax=Aspergillus granulosus TaxID=176169 RepID=A0ABR4I3R2_9EURO
MLAQPPLVTLRCIGSAAAQSLCLLLRLQRPTRPSRLAPSHQTIFPIITAAVASASSKFWILASVVPGAGADKKMVALGIAMLRLHGVPERNR